MILRTQKKKKKKKDKKKHCSEKILVWVFKKYSPEKK